MLSTVSVTSYRILSAAEAKLTSFIGMTIFNNGLQFRIREDDKFRAMVRAARNISRNYKLPGRETVLGPLLDNCFENHIKNQREKLLNGADIYGIHFQGDGATINKTCSSPRRAVRSHSLVCSENPFSIVGIGPIPVKEL